MLASIPWTTMRFLIVLCTLVCLSYSVPRHLTSILEDSFVLIASGKRIVAANGTLGVTTVEDNAACARNCLEDKKCFAVNYDDGDKSCELLSSNLNLSETEDQGNCTIFHRRIDCSDEPCHKGSTCQDSNETTNDYRGYTCSCNCGWCGWNCDTINFAVIEDKCIPMYNGGFKEVEAVKECMEFCSETPGCRSSDYLFTDEGQKQCWLNLVDDTTVDLDPCDDIPQGYSIGYAYFNCTCPDEISMISV